MSDPHEYLRSSQVIICPHLCSLLETSRPDVIVSSSFFSQVDRKLSISSSSLIVNVTYARSVCTCASSVFGSYCDFNFPKIDAKFVDF